MEATSQLSKTEERGEVDKNQSQNGADVLSLGVLTWG